MMQCTHTFTICKYQKTNQLKANSLSLSVHENKISNKKSKKKDKRNQSNQFRPTNRAH